MDYISYTVMINKDVPIESIFNLMKKIFMVNEDNIMICDELDYFKDINWVDNLLIFLTYRKIHGDFLMYWNIDVHKSVTDWNEVTLAKQLFYNLNVQPAFAYFDPVPPFSYGGIAYWFWMRAPDDIVYFIIAEDDDDPDHICIDQTYGLRPTTHFSDQ